MQGELKTFCCDLKKCDYVNDLPDVVSTTTKMFTDDTKVIDNISCHEDCNWLHSDLHSLSS